jgi:hypothetical protein
MTQGAATHKRVLTPSELELAEAMSKALVNKIGAQLALDGARQEIGRLTTEINKLGRPEEGKKPDYAGVARATIVWAEARELAGVPNAATASDLVRR